MDFHGTAVLFSALSLSDDMFQKARRAFPVHISDYTPRNHRVNTRWGDYLFSEK
jgi:hypothetical protein